uniref:Uncharacterized protein n=1 Tax=Chromera velia CCMP2878 TaxID=1169474 RepID=A0A0G4IDQ9_9ALVE|mmetsp:Transcript_32224/g.63953  ORF Transcript_32224/g.63953 Transcript_32224/m.63953 type:complete len:210 (-) Transcript_32224:169-798(-)|eukprot:Cvel_13519.t1-p1 / transcript=Cvel_13519.t1 / gene=Cvel_13519 / organism=Chromera_velia_CCMP2878 / gene_product=hypothetical protein / transcript_product=hypothetical protein / location=Cvel_scaffold927:36585-37211(-) / protein_length=209 / sequence_SO=supercontig / SO=protein_coding / is_pseudo=false
MTLALKYRSECLEQLQKLRMVSAETILSASDVLAVKSFEAGLDFVHPACLAFLENWKRSNAEGKVMTLWVFHRVLVTIFRQGYERSLSPLLREWKKKGWDLFLSLIGPDIVQMKRASRSNYFKVMRLPPLLAHTPNNTLPDGTECRLFAEDSMRALFTSWGGSSVRTARHPPLAEMEYFYEEFATDRGTSPRRRREEVTREPEAEPEPG